MTGWSSKYSYTENNIDLYVPICKGVYRLIHKKGEDYYIFYVGQSDNLPRRLGEHLSDTETNKCIKRYLQNFNCYFRFIEITLQDERDRFEEEEIKKYKPLCNS